MASRNIEVNGIIFPCPVGWNVDQAETRIRSRYLLAGGGLEEEGVPLLGTDLIGNTVGTLSFAGGQPIQQAGAGAGAGTGASSATSASETVLVDHPRKRKWDRLNKAIGELSDYKEAKRGDRRGIWSCPYSSIGWEKVRDAFGQLQHLTIEPKEDRLSDAEIDYLVGQYQWMRKSLGVPSGGKEAKRFLFIAPIFICIVGHFADLGQRVELLIEENVDGQRIKVNGHFEFVIKRGDKRIYIVEAKKDDMEQGLAQDLLGLEVLADIDDLETVIGVVTNFNEWIFAKSCVEHVEVRYWNLELNEKEIPTRAALSQVTTYLISLLSAD